MVHVALVTGGSSGIGRAAALALAARGSTVYAAARGVDRMADLERQGIRVLALDLTDDDSLRAAVGTVLAEQSRIDVLVNSAGYGAFGSIEETPLDAAREQFQVNLFGLARLTQLVLPAMRAQGSGRIVNISSLAGFLASPLGGWYAASKFALEAMSDSLRVEVAQFGIDVVLVEPGPVRTAWHARADGGLRHVSSSGPYAALARGVSKVITGFDDEPITSDAEDVAAVIVKAATADRPRPPVPRGPWRASRGGFPPDPPRPHLGQGGAPPALAAGLTRVPDETRPGRCGTAVGRRHAAPLPARPRLP